MSNIVVFVTSILLLAPIAVSMIKFRQTKLIQCADVVYPEAAAGQTEMMITNAEPLCKPPTKARTLCFFDKRLVLKRAIKYL